MTESSKLGVVLSIEHDQRLDLTTNGEVVQGYETYIREYVGMLDSGLMARMSNTGYKVLHALALRARILGDARRPGAVAEFKELKRLGIVSEEDQGQLFCFPSRDQVSEDTGIGSLHTVDAALDELTELQLVRRITGSQPRFGRGFFGANIYLIYPGSFIRKFNSGNGEQKVPPAEGAGGEQKLPSAPETESSLRNTVNRALKRQDLTTTTTREARPEIDHIVQFFFQITGAEHHEPTEKEISQIGMLLQDGYSEEQIREGIRCAHTHAQQKGRKVNLSFCIRSVRHLDPRQSEIVPGSGKSSMGEIVTPADRRSREGKSSAQIVTAPGKSYALPLEDLELNETERSEMEQLLLLVGEHSNRALSKADARRWKTLADEFVGLADTRGVTPFALVRQAVEEALDAGSARDGYCAPKLARAILSRWKNVQDSETNKKTEKPKREIPAAVQVYREVRRRFPAQELWDSIAQTVGAEESALAFWSEVLKAWVARGYNPLNIEGPLQWFKAHSIPQNGYGRSTSAPVQTQRPIEKLEVIQERLRGAEEQRGES